MKRSLLILLLACFVMGADAHELGPWGRANQAYQAQPRTYQANPSEWVERQETRHRLQRLEDNQRWEWMMRQNRQGR